MNLSTNQIELITKMLDEILDKISKIRKIFEQNQSPTQRPMNHHSEVEKMNPLKFGEDKTRVGVYSSSLKGDRRVVKLVPDGSINWDSKPISWLCDQIDSHGYHIDSSFVDNLVVEMDKGEKFGKLLGQVAWAFDAMNKPKEGRK